MLTDRKLGNERKRKSSQGDTMRLLDQIGERVADEVEKVAAGRQSNCEEAARDILALLNAARSESSIPQGWGPISEAPMRSDPSAPMEPVLISWTNRDGYPGVGEAYWHPEDPDGGGWWWANTSPGDYFSGPVLESITGQITHFMPLPPAPSLEPSNGGGE